MLGVAVYIVVEAVGRIGTTPQIATGPMLVVGTLGLVVNLVCVVLLRGGAGESLNVKGAYLEVVADTLGSVGVIAAALLVTATGNAFWDTGIALAIAAFVAVRAVLLGREVLVVLGQHAPVAGPRGGGRLPGGRPRGHRRARPAPVDADLRDERRHGAPGHRRRCRRARRPDRAGEIMRTRFGVEHATLQVEPDTHSGCKEVTW